MTVFVAIATAVSFIILVLTALWALKINRGTYRSSRLLTPSRVMAVGVAAASWVMFFPHYFYAYAGFPPIARFWESFWISAHHTIRLFIIDTDFSEISYTAAITGVDLYAVLGTVLFLLAPLMTAGVILSFFKNFSSYRKCFFNRKSDTYVFSDLSEKSLALAADIRKNHPDVLLIFTDVFEETTDIAHDLSEKAKELGAVCFQKDILNVNLSFISKSSKLYFFMIAENEEENVKQVFGLSREDGLYAQRENVFLYVFSTSIESEILLSNLPQSKIRVRRVDDIRSLVTRILYDSGEKLFETALPARDGKKVINAVVVGTGGHGKEMIKSLSWFCQMEGYRVVIHAFDREKNAEERFTMLAPELMSERNNGVYVPGEAQYKIVFHSGISVDDIGFWRAFKTIGTPTFVFVSLGADAINVRTAVTIRQILRQQHMPDPIIQAIVYDTQNKDILNQAKNWRDQSYNIEFIGDLAEMYSERVILQQDLEDEALATHRRYNAPEETFYRFEYNYRSSMASALHRNLRHKLNIADFEKETDELTVEERDLLERIEHNRWNAYMRSEGYVYSGSPSAESRDDLAKMHHNLVPFDELSEEDKRKDSMVGVRK